MRLYFQTDSENDQVYIGLRRDDSNEGVAARTIRVNDEIALDINASGGLVGIDISNASKVLGANAFDELSPNDEVIGVAEAAEICEVKKPNFIRDFANRPDFPKPMAELASGRLWYRSDVIAYLADGQPTPEPSDKAASGVVFNVYEYLQVLLATDELAFRHNALTYLDSMARHGARSAPSIEDLTDESIREDLRLTNAAQAGNVDLYVEAAWELRQKYAKSLDSYIAGLLPTSGTLQPERISKEVWVDALKRIQLGEYSPETKSSFTRWLLGLANMLLEAHGIEVGEIGEVATDPLEAAAQAKKLGEALATQRSATEQLQTELLVLDYLNQLTSEELVTLGSSRGSGVGYTKVSTDTKALLRRRLRQVKKKLQK